jgi:hypothetical protein
VAEVLLEEALPEDAFNVYWRVTMPALMRCFRSPDLQISRASDLPIYSWY